MPTQQAVAGGMALAVVDHLEVIEVDEQQRHGHLVTAVQLQLPIELLLEGAVVAQAGEAVVQRVLAGFAIEHLELRLGLGQVVEGLQEGARHDDGDEQHDDGEGDERHDEHVARCLGRQRPEVDEAEVGAVVGLPQRRRGGGPAAPSRARVRCPRDR